MARILIVDDEISDRILKYSILEDAGHELIAAADGRAALSLYHGQPIDLVITDILMPKLDGLELIYEIRQSYPDARIIAVSGVSRDDLKRALDLGAVETLFKPVKREELLDAVKRALG
ncbi:MAG: response regulator [Gemmatimonadetes bacterium]|nr:response regulator [Gemmatimonadota bacterium]